MSGRFGAAEPHDHHGGWGLLSRSSGDSGLRFVLLCLKHTPIQLRTELGDAPALGRQTLLGQSLPAEAKTRIFKAPVGVCDGTVPSEPGQQNVPGISEERVTVQNARAGSFGVDFHGHREALDAGWRIEDRAWPQEAAEQAEMGGP